MESDNLRKKLEKELRKKGVSTIPVIDRAMVISYLARLSEKELQQLLADVQQLRNGVWKPLEESKKYKHKEIDEKKTKLTK